MTSPLDRAALADALASATADDLREDAEVCRSALAYAGNDRTAASLQRLAALALACADLEENGRSVLFGITKTGRVVLIDEDGAGYTAKGDTLPRALAALLKGDQ